MVDPWADPDDVFREYQLELTPFENVKDMDCCIIAVKHREFSNISLETLKTKFRPGPDQEKVLIDVKGLYPVETLRNAGLRYWRL